MLGRKRQIFIAAAIISLSAVSAVFANASVNIAVKALSTKLKSDLAVENLDLKLVKINRQVVSKSEVRFSGSGAANNLPLNFDVKVDVTRQTPVNVNYNFVDTAAPGIASADMQESLTRDLLYKLNKDYKTENIVISIDDFDTKQQSGTKVFKGTGDVRLGFDWSRISFDVSIDDKTGEARFIKYEIHQ